MVLSVPEGWEPLYLSCVVMAGFGNLTLASVRESPSPRVVFWSCSIKSSCLWVHVKPICLLFGVLCQHAAVVGFCQCVFQRPTVCEASVQDVIRPSESPAAVPTGRIRSEINLPSVEMLMCQCSLELTGVMEQRNERGCRVNPQ